MFCRECMVFIGPNANKFHCNDELLSLNCGGEM